VIYTVVWTAKAQGQLAALWLRATDRRAVTRASHNADQLLRRDPETRGEEFFGDRLLVEPPLQVVFSIHPDDRQVEVEEVW